MIAEEAHRVLNIEFAGQDKEIRRDFAFHYYFTKQNPGFDNASLLHHMNNWSEQRESFEAAEAAMSASSNEFRRRDIVSN
jgi:hypothetical protein